MQVQKWRGFPSDPRWLRKHKAGGPSLRCVVEEKSGTDPLGVRAGHSGEEKRGNLTRQMERTHFRFRLNDFMCVFYFEVKTKWKA